MAPPGYAPVCMPDDTAPLQAGAELVFVPMQPPLAGSAARSSFVGPAEMQANPDLRQYITAPSPAPIIAGQGYPNMGISMGGVGFPSGQPLQI